MKKNKIFTKKELEIINKRIMGKSLTQIESNRLSVSIRPKLKDIYNIDAKDLLEKLEYNQKIISIENKIKKTILDSLIDVKCIILYGSAIITNYKEYNDIDIMIVTKKKSWTKLKEKYAIIKDIKNKLVKLGLNPDIEIYDKINFNKNYYKNPSLIYQLKDSKIIYGDIKINKKIEVDKMDLVMKLDYSYPEEDLEPSEIYKSIRNIFLINLIIQKIVDNKALNNKLKRELSENLIYKLKYNSLSDIEKNLCISILKKSYLDTLNNLKKSKWEKIEL